MAGKLFNIYSGNTGGVLSTSTAKVGSFGTTSDDFYSVNFDTGRKSIWTNNIEFGRAADWGNISGIPSWIESDGVTWGKVNDKPATATRWPYWSEILSKPAAIGSATQPVYWDGSTFQLVNSVAPASHDHDDKYLKLTGGTLSGDLAFSHGSSSTDQHITWASGTNYQRLKVRDGQTDVFIFQYSTDSGTTWSDYFTIQNGTAKIGTYTVYHSGNLPAYPTVNNGALYIQANSTTKVTFTANQSGNSTFNIATGSVNGTISVGGTDVVVKGLGSNAYSSTAYLPLAGGQMIGNITWKNSTALPEQSSPQYFLVIDAFTDGGATKWASKANTLNALTGLTSTAKGTTSKPIYWDGTKFVECLAYSQASVNYANSAGTATNLENNPSLQAGTADTKKITVTAGGKTSAEFTVPYATSSNDTNVLNIKSIDTEASIIESGIRAYSGGGSSWTGSISSMAYAAILTFGYPSRGWQLWAQRGNGSLIWRNGTSDQTTWNDERTLLDSVNYTTYTVKKDGTGATGSWNINAATATKLQTARTITINGSSKTFDGTGNISWSLADLNLPSNEHNHDDRYLKLSGGTMTGVLHLLGAQYTDSAGTGALDLANSDIYGVNSIKFADLSDGAGEGLQWYRDATHTDSLWVKNGVIYFTPNRTWGGTGIDYTVWHSGNDGTGSGLDADLLDGVHANGLFTNFSNKTVSGNKVLAATIGGTELTVAVEYAGSAGSANILNLSASIGTSSDTHATALQNYFNANKSSIQRNKLNTYYSSAYGNGSFYMGYFLSGYDSNPYGGFFVAHYGTPYYVGIANGTYNQQTILTSSNYTDYTVKKDGTGASGTWGISITGNAATADSATNADKLDTFHAADLFQTFTNDATNNAVKIKIGNTEKSLVVGYATKANSANSASKATALDPESLSDFNSGTNWRMFYSSGSQSTNRPVTGVSWYNGITFASNNSNSFKQQLAIGLDNPHVYFRNMNNGTWDDWVTLLDSNNSSVSKSGETLSVKINGTTQSLTNTWRGITDSYNVDSPSSSTSLSQKGAKALYSALINGYANQAGNADTVDGYHADDLLPYGLENICIGAVASGGRTILSNSIITTTGENADTYFYVRCTEKLEAGQIYTMGFYVTGVPSGNTSNWSWPVGSQSNSNWVVTVNKNGWCWGTGTVSNDIDAGTNIIIDDSNRGFYNSITISKFVIVKGRQRPYHTWPVLTIKNSYVSEGKGYINGTEITKVNNADSVAWANITGKATSKTAWGQTFVDSSGNIQSISGNMTSVGQVTPDVHATRDNGTSSANWATVYSYALRSNDNLTLRSGTSKDIIFQTNAGTEYMRLTSGGRLGIGTNSPNTAVHMKGDLLIDNDFSSNDHGIFFRKGFTSTSRKYNVSILAYDHNGDGGSPDGLSINGYDGISFCTGSDNRNEVVRITGGSSPGNVGIGTTSPADKLDVHGIIRSTSNGKYLRIGCQNSSWAHYNTDASSGHYFNPGISVDGAISIYGTNYGIRSGGEVHGNGFYHRSYLDNNYVLLSNGGAKQWSESATASTIVARNSSGYVYAVYYNSAISNQNDMSPTSVYCSNDNWIRKQSIGKFADNLRSDEIITITKEDLTVTEAWMDTGIVMNTATFPRGTGTYAIQITSNTAGTDGWYPYFSGIITIYTSTTNGTLPDEVPLHCIGHSNNGDARRIYIRTIEGDGNTNGKIQIAGATTLSAHTYTFKFRKLI